MRCEEIREHIVDCIYHEGGGSTAAREIEEHLRACSACRAELEELRQTQKYLQLWKDEDPLRTLSIVGNPGGAPRRFNWKYPRYAAIAAMVMLCFLALANTQISWNSHGFSFSTRLFGGSESERDYYTKSEVLDIMKRALDDSELRMNETSYLMMQKMLDTVEQERWMDLRLVRNRAASIQNSN